MATIWATFKSNLGNFGENSVYLLSGHTGHGLQIPDGICITFESFYDLDESKSAFSWSRVVLMYVESYVESFVIFTYIDPRLLYDNKQPLRLVDKYHFLLFKVFVFCFEVDSMWFILYPWDESISTIFVDSKWFYVLLLCLWQWRDLHGMAWRMTNDVSNNLIQKKENPLRCKLLFASLLFILLCFKFLSKIRIALTF